jgi:hypothetical protein
MKKHAKQQRISPSPFFAPTPTLKNKCVLTHANKEDKPR